MATIDPAPPIYKALLAARRKFGPVIKDAKNPHLGNRYADLAAVIDAIDAHLVEAGVLIVQTITGDDNGRAVLTRLIHADSGTEVFGEVPLHYATEGSKLNPMQCLGSAITYARRYGLLGLLCLHGEDDDGSTAGVPDRPRQAAAAPAAPATDRLPSQGRAPYATKSDYNAQGGPKQYSTGPSQAPATGGALFSWLKEESRIRGIGTLIDQVQRWGLDHGYPERMVAWSGPQVVQARREAAAILRLAAVGADDANDARDGSDGNED